MGGKSLIVVTRIPERKRPCLFVKTAENAMTLVASFQNDDAAEMFCDAYNKTIDMIYERIGEWTI